MWPSSSFFKMQRWFSPQLEFCLASKTCLRSWGSGSVVKHLPSIRPYVLSSLNTGWGGEGCALAKGKNPAHFHSLSWNPVTTRCEQAQTGLMNGKDTRSDLVNLHLPTENQPTHQNRQPPVSPPGKHRYMNDAHVIRTTYLITDSWVIIHNAVFYATVFGVREGLLLQRNNCLSPWLAKKVELVKI